MISIPFTAFELVFAFLWFCAGILTWIRRGKIDWKKEALLLLMYVNLAVVLRFTFFPRALRDGHVQPLIFDPSKIIPLRVNLIPLLHLMDFANTGDLIWNVAGNIALFIPTGILLPMVFKKLRTFPKTLAAGAGISLLIEIVQLLFYERATDIDDLILNSLGVAVGFGIYALARKIGKAVKKPH